ncbi:hypothetical protein KC982_04180 [Proteus mirabilis]|uniref:hypothetical protein n=1 Tax=Proteus mirabilis TaxID=584 RepID=UPI003314BA34
MFLCEVNRNHHHVSLRYFGHLRLTRQQEGSPPVTLSGLFFGNAFIQFFTELSWVIETLCCHDISPLKSPAIARRYYYFLLPN